MPSAKKVPFFDGTLPEAGAIVDLGERCGKGIARFTPAKRYRRARSHRQSARRRHGSGISRRGRHLLIASVEFGDPALSASHTVQQLLSDVQGKPYSRMTIDLFLSEQLRPVYLQQGYLRVKLGPPEVRLTGNPNQKMPEQIPVFVPVVNRRDLSLERRAVVRQLRLSSITLSNELGLKPGDVANGMQIEAGWDRVREEYGHHGYLDAKLRSRGLLR